ncbi:MAG: holin family protein [Gammaproteobacteria bacterium]|nr:holin family protein [Gammaproteobacteria bacterium]MDH5732143.1 holin family protein [Gammaproteobacteria bacterium]
MGIDINPVTSAIKAGTAAVETVAGVFTSNKEKDAQRSADEQMALLRAYQAEFNQKENRNWIDSFADGFNRLVRPFIVSIVVFIFILAYINPTHFAQITLALSSIPNGYWGLLSVIITFYFGGRMQLKSHDFQFKQSQLEAVRALVETKKEFRKLETETDEPDKLVGDSVAKADGVDKERETQMNEVIERFLKAEKEGSDPKQVLQETVKELNTESETRTQQRQKRGPRRWR